jgi:hemerythrin superfamily protein
MNAKSVRSTGGQGRTAPQVPRSPEGDAIAYLERQHREVEELFRQIATADAEDGRAAILRTISDGLAIHAAIEEHHLYAAARPKLADTVSEGIMDNHRGIQRILSDIVDVSVGDPNFDAKLKELRDEVERHVASEERKLFPRIRRLMPATELAGIAEKMREEQAALEGTEPRLQVHPDRLPAARLH